MKIVISWKSTHDGYNFSHPSMVLEEVADLEAWVCALLDDKSANTVVGTSYSSFETHTISWTGKDWRSGAAFIGAIKFALNRHEVPNFCIRGTTIEGLTELEEELFRIVVNHGMVQESFKRLDRMPEGIISPGASLAYPLRYGRYRYCYATS